MKKNCLLRGGSDFEVLNTFALALAIHNLRNIMHPKEFIRSVSPEDVFIRGTYVFSYKFYQIVQNKGPFNAGFFLTSTAEKTKTQGQNSRKKLNLWEDFPSHVQNSRKILKFIKKFLKTQNFQRGGSFYAIFIDKYFQKHKKLEKFAIILSKF